MAARLLVEITGSPYSYDRRIDRGLIELNHRVRAMREVGALRGDALLRLRTFFRIKNIYHSNAIEGNSLDVGETRLVVEEGLTISGKPLKDSLEAKNLAHALDLLEHLSIGRNQPGLAVEVRQLHQAVLAGIDDGNAGRYRTSPVEISGSAFRPPAPEKIEPEMGDFHEWLRRQTSPQGTLDPVLLASAAHAWFVTIHPFIGGNGRAARLLMNLMLMRAAYPIAVITREDRFRYYDALEHSQAGGDLTPFVEVVLESIDESIEQYEVAASEQREQVEWAQSIVKKFGGAERDRIQGEYEMWKSAMDLVKGFFQQTARILTEQAFQTAKVYFKDFGYLEFEKFLSLRAGTSAKKTWFFRVDFTSGNKSARYLFFFGFPSEAMSAQGAQVTLHVSFESDPFYYERLDSTYLANKPDVVEVGFRAPETFLFRNRSGRVQEGRLEEFGKQFFEQVGDREF